MRCGRSARLAALAVDDELLDLDERVSDTIDERRDDPRKSSITVRELLSLSGGIEPLSSALESPSSATATGIVDRVETSIAACARREGDTNDRAAVDTSAIEGVMAAGKGKQRLYILPGHDLVVVRFGAVDGGRDFEDARFLAPLLGGAAEDADADRTTGEADGTIAPC